MSESGNVLGYAIVRRDPDGTLDQDSLGSWFDTPADAVRERDLAQGWTDQRGQGEQWVAVAITEVPR